MKEKRSKKYKIKKIKPEFFAEGKTKICFKTKNKNELKIKFKNVITAFNNKTTKIIFDKGKVVKEISTLFFESLNLWGFKTHFIKPLDSNTILVEKLKMIPVEVVVRNFASGSICKRLNLKKGYAFSSPIVEFFYKNDYLKDPMVNDNHLVELKTLTYLEIEYIKLLALQINSHLRDIIEYSNLKLIDFKLEFGFTKDNEICLGDELSPDNMRIWDLNNKVFDKDIFRKRIKTDLLTAYSFVLKGVKKGVKFYTTCFNENKNELNKLSFSSIRKNLKFKSFKEKFALEDCKSENN